MKTLYFSFEGRIGRKTWWLGMLGVIAAMIVAQITIVGLAMVSEVAGLVGVALGLTIALAGLVGSIAIQIKRWHDVDKPGWWLLIGFIPIIGLYALYMNGFVKGTDGQNQFGSDPVSDHRSPTMQTA